MSAGAARRSGSQARLPAGQDDRQALLDQRNLAGIGTIYRAETPFLRGVNPWCPVAAALKPASRKSSSAPAPRICSEHKAIWALTPEISGQKIRWTARTQRRRKKDEC